MKNLAGHPEASNHCAAELKAAGIEPIIVDPYGEPNSVIAGRLNGIEFRRAWYYWAAEGKVPLDVAQRLYADPVGKRDVRVAGHCGCPPPEEWARAGAVWNYHIDSAEGLKLFADAVRGIRR